MNSYRDRPDAIRALVQEDRVHRDLYLSEELFALEQERFFANTWLYVGHASQVPNTGDYWALELAGRPVMMVRQADGAVRVFYNRCAHKGSRLVTDESGNAGKFFRCPYHAWTYKLDGAPLAIPLKSGYEGTRLKECESGRGLVELKNTAVYRDFVFVRLADRGPGFEEYFGEVLRAIDNMVERSPEGRLTVGGGVLRNIIHCNWKMYLENINDTVHPMSTHESATQAADALWQGRSPDEPKPMAMEQILPFGSGYDFFDKMGGRVFANGHSVLGINFSIHSNYAQLPDYEAAMREAHGAERAMEILQRSPQNSVLFPSLSVKGSPQAIRVIRPLAANRTLVEAWSFRAAGAPDLLFERAMTYNRLVFSPMSVVAHDDVHLFESMQRGLAAEGNDWISLHRNFDPAELAQDTISTNGTNELLMRNQFRAWARFMTEPSA
ncbi:MULTISPECIES: aromatic ring-hydroxylating dioxygenase subunit alpha [unclassified Variovorax]|uniref:aromatic ring-hydroxylating dioxygenase subunit alpha n=1 Tax=unclassified Variovorax TaxID=663243 RepID=UPI00076C47DE|nr:MULTISPECIES: aromatic ring-hydroxylating dioxygenase subunit alpha [unclassified Variovorax]KWT98912.1 3-phenylpropionate dioxygenase alpha subunit [Variovorax sp. WDL1]PNG51862.1 Biphenyl dioxygenase subunit alpha [Variovorax sp. B2]PNG54209.1 Biphenyl dioxygenase subunit alpha [Variovorax sp. B4]VTV11695.1 Biphenyl dioxygenase subunit alpha [Variovorax sp. WDL1]